MNPLETLAPMMITGAMIVIACAIMATLLRTLVGPRMSDRIVGVNMIGTQSICLIVCLTLRLRESWLVDIAIVYAMFSFLAVTVLTKMDIGVYREWRDNQRKSRERDLKEKATLAKAESDRRKARRDRYDA